MLVRTDRGELAERLQGIGGIVASGASSTKPILQDVLLSASGEEFLIEATDLDLSARLRVERVEIEREGRLALPAAKLQSLSREIPGMTVTLEGPAQEAAGDVFLRAEGYDFRLLGDDPAEFPDLPEFRADSALAVNREKLIESLRRVSIAASRDQGRFQLTGVFFEIEPEKLTLTATDGKRLTHDVLRIDNPDAVSISAIVPNRAIDVLVRVLAGGEEAIRLAISETEIQVDFGFGQVMAKVIEGTYPDYRSALPTEKKTKVSVKRSDLLAAVRSAALVTERESASVLFRFEEGRAVLQSRASDVGESKIEVPISFEGDPVEIRFNPMFLVDALKTINEEQVRMEFSGADRPCTIRGGLHFRHLLMPLVVG